MTAIAPFRGPLFVVGEPRSGTTLLRNLLSQHSQIGLAMIETTFIPSMVRDFGDPPGFDNPDRAHRFFHTFTQTQCFQRGGENGCVLTLDFIREHAPANRWDTLIEAILRFYAPPGRKDALIWGDKTPGYLNHMELLHRMFPQAKFLHIIRDPRDHCLSEHKAWGKSLYRSADKWVRRIRAAQSVARQLGDDYRELRYETLIDDPSAALNQLCDWMGVTFEPQMADLRKPSDKLGDSQGLTRVNPDNREKYREQLSPRQLRRLEEIVCELAGELGYTMVNDVRPRPMGPLRRKWLMLLDALALTRFHIRQQGLVKGIRYVRAIRREKTWA